MTYYLTAAQAATVQTLAHAGREWGTATDSDHAYGWGCCDGCTPPGADGVADTVLLHEPEGGEYAICSRCFDQASEGIYGGAPWDEDEPYSHEARFHDPGGRSALHAGARIHPCPTCNAPDRLTDRDVQAGYQCDRCADADEGGW